VEAGTGASGRQALEPVWRQAGGGGPAALEPVCRRAPEPMWRSAGGGGRVASTSCRWVPEPTVGGGVRAWWVGAYVVQSE
jgi:hypothetical protein